MSEANAVKEVTGDVALKIIESGVPVVVDFWATWCGPCKAVLPKLISAAAEVPDVQFLKVSIEEASGRSLAANCAVSGIPTLIKYDKNNEINRMVGAGSLSDILTLAKSA